MKMSKNLADLRNNHHDFSLGNMDINLSDSPFDIFSSWFDNAIASGELESNACVVSTVSLDLQPSSRIVYLKELQDEAFIFYTNYASQKGKEIQNNPKASMLFFWPKSERQVRIEGLVSKLPESVSDAYFDSRPLQSKLGAWSSHQSDELHDQKELVERMAFYENKFGENVPRPPHWGGYALTPTLIEFWQGKSSRLHDRIVFELLEGNWKIYRKNP
jgi:pyridoxamine 5'-phosphate oxidase